MVFITSQDGKIIAELTGKTLGVKECYSMENESFGETRWNVYLASGCVVERIVGAYPSESDANKQLEKFRSALGNCKVQNLQFRFE